MLVMSLQQSHICLFKIHCAHHEVVTCTQQASKLPEIKLTIFVGIQCCRNKKNVETTDPVKSDLRIPQSLTS